VNIRRRFVSAFVVSTLALVSLTSDSSAHNKELFANGDVRLGACNGASAAYVAITAAEDADGLGLGADDKAALLTNVGTGQSGVAFYPDYSSLTSNQKAGVQFSVASLFFKGDDSSVNHTSLSLCFGDGTSKTVALKDLKLRAEGFGWRKAQFGPSSLGIKDEDAKRLDRISVSLSGEGRMEVGNLVPYWEINRPDGKQLFFGWNLLSNLIMTIEDCSILNGCK